MIIYSIQNFQLLPEVIVKTLEEDEEELLKLRAKLFRYASYETPPEWKERGTGEIKILKHLTNGTARILMRRDKTLKICANHYIQPWMSLKPNCGSNRAWVWSVSSDYADEESKSELLAVRFSNTENAVKFKDVFEEVKQSLEGGREKEAPLAKLMKEKSKDGATEKLSGFTFRGESTSESGTGSESSFDSNDDFRTKESKGRAEMDEGQADDVAEEFRKGLCLQEGSSSDSDIETSTDSESSESYEGSEEADDKKPDDEERKMKADIQDTDSKDQISSSDICADIDFIQ